jgi:hypothetical protein
MMPAFHPSHTLWKSLRDSHIPTASTTGYISFHTLKPNHRYRKGLVTDVSGPQRNASPGTLTPERLLLLSLVLLFRKSGSALRAGTGPLRWVAENPKGSELGRKPPP